MILEEFNLEPWVSVLEHANHLTSTWTLHEKCAFEHFTAKTMLEFLRIEHKSAVVRLLCMDCFHLYVGHL